jgi:hypothetical protein
MILINPSDIREEAGVTPERGFQPSQPSQPSYAMRQPVLAQPSPPTLSTNLPTLNIEDLKRINARLHNGSKIKQGTQRVSHV